MSSGNVAKSAHDIESMLRQRVNALCTIRLSPPIRRRPLRGFGERVDLMSLQKRMVNMVLVDSFATANEKMPVVNTMDFRTPMHGRQIVNCFHGFDNHLLVPLCSAVMSMIPNTRSRF